MKDRLRGYTVNLLLFTVSLFVCYVILEVGLRLWLYGGLRWEFAHLPEIRRDTHPALGWKLLPDQTSTSVSLDYRVVIKTNSKGYRDQERSLEKEEGVFRILLLGDSHMEAAFPHVLQWRLRNPERGLVESLIKSSLEESVCDDADKDDGAADVESR